jgi:hypothetical protein
MGSKWILRRLAGGCVEGNHLAQDRDRWQTVVNSVIDYTTLQPSRPTSTFHRRESLKSYEWILITVATDEIFEGGNV